MLTLYEHLSSQGLVDFEGLSDTDYNVIAEVLETTFIAQNPIDFSPPAYFEYDNVFKHALVIDKCIMWLLLNQRYENVLTFGYHVGKEHNIINNLFNESTNTQVSFIKASEGWKCIHKLIGSMAFIKLLMGSIIITYDKNIDSLKQIAGTRLNSYDMSTKESNFDHNTKFWKDRSLFSNSAFLHRSNYDGKFKRPFLISGIEGQYEIMNLKSELFPNYCGIVIPKSMRAKIDILLHKFMHNYKYIKCYRAILDNVCPNNTNHKGQYSNLDLATDPKLVCKYVIILLEKLLPQEMFGSKRCKAHIFKWLARFLNLPYQSSIELNEIMNGLKIKDFNWLKVPSKLSFSKTKFKRHELELTTRLVENFIIWLYKIMIPRLISSFFYVTEISSTTDLLYFRQDVWYNISKPFLSVYFDRYLVENECCQDSHTKQVPSYIHNMIRLIPKKVDKEFRVIAIPRKGLNKQEIDVYHQRKNHILQPIRSILEYLRYQRITEFAKIKSTSDIPNAVKNYKERLKARYRGSIPPLSVLKFDIESCYDSIPVEKMMQTIENIIREAGCEGFYLRSFSFFNTNSGTFKTSYIVNGSRDQREDEISIDNCKTMYMSSHQMIEALRHELFHNVLTFKGKCYSRKTGIFQGSILSSVLVDILYDDVLEKRGGFSGNDLESTVLKLADDFLIISTNERNVDVMKNQASEGFGEYNARSNQRKVVHKLPESLFPTQLDFCALTIDLVNLQIWKSANKMNVPLITFSSKRKLFHRLLAFYKLRLSNGTIDLKLNNTNTVLLQIKEIALNIGLTLVKALNFKKNKISVIQLSSFFDSMVRELQSTDVSTVMHNPQNYLVVEGALLDGLEIALSS